MRVLLLLLSACSVSAYAPVCGAGDPTCDPGGCVEGDEDGDGVCNDDDVCAEGDDADDADDDGLADACDGCPDLAGDDPDGDGLCGEDDPCPEVEGATCTEKVIVALQADVFPEDLTWQVVDWRGGLVRNGTFGNPGGGGFYELEVEPDRDSCLTVRDAERDGGARGLVFSRGRGVRYLRFDGEDAEVGFSGCFNPSAGETFRVPTEAAWLDDGACDVVIEIYTGKRPRELGWALEKPGADPANVGRVVTDMPVGAYAQADRAATERLTLTDGLWVLRQFDAAGDGWNRDGDNATYKVSFASGTEIVSGTLDGGSSGWRSFLIDCD